MEASIENIIDQQIAAAIDALNKVKSMLASAEAERQLGIAASFIQDIQFNMIFVRAGEHPA